MIPTGVEKLPISKWTNKHENFTHKLKMGSSFSLYNPPGTTRRERYLATTRNFQWLINYAKKHEIKLRAMGSGWSFTKVGLSPDGIVNTSPLNFSFPITAKYTSQKYKNTPADLYFVQCGTLIYELNRRLASRNDARSIKASGASNGQTLAGATATGTHGAAFKFGAVHDAIVGIHLVNGSDKHVWIERESYPVASKNFLKWLDADVIRDDDVFNSVVVGFGSFGFIHGLMIETSPIFLLEEHRLGNLPYNDALKKAMRTLDFSSLNIEPEEEDKSLYHFEVLFNIHEKVDNPSNRDAFLKYIYKKPYTTDYIPVKHSELFTYGEDLAGIISTVLDALGPSSEKLIPTLVNQMFSLAFKPTPPQTGTLGEIFNYTKFRGKIASCAIGITAENSPRVVDAIIEINKKHSFPGGLAFRYVKGTSAVLGFTRFKQTCVLEMDGIESLGARRFYAAVWDHLEKEQIKYTLHWGKINFNLNEERLKWMYGEEAFGLWKKVREELLPGSTKAIFENEFMKQCGLD
ncbi:FAD-binding protein [Christiangramia crocea]|uniref:FAD-binding protein n=1 Tax=Christiangramia crocea TaxID=2904124 RepID=A0A9X1UYJ9_9FLAO|nr:FAD-binding protein [Gramella crocea]MCG9972576.1 FAD-binding protein [Gramella crocea]